QLGAAALEEALEDLAEVAVDLRERGGESVLGRARHAAERFFQVLDRRREVVVLRPQEREALVKLAVLLVGHEVHGTDGGQLGVPRADAISAGRGLARSLG